MRSVGTAALGSTYAHKSTTVHMPPSFVLFPHCVLSWILSIVDCHGHCACKRYCTACFVSAMQYNKRHCMHPVHCGIGHSADGFSLLVPVQTEATVESVACMAVSRVH